MKPVCFFLLTIFFLFPLDGVCSRENINFSVLVSNLRVMGLSEGEADEYMQSLVYRLDRHFETAGYPLIQVSQSSGSTRDPSQPATAINHYDYRVVLSMEISEGKYIVDVRLYDTRSSSPFLSKRYSYPGIDELYDGQEEIIQAASNALIEEYTNNVPKAARTTRHSYFNLTAFLGGGVGRIYPDGLITDEFNLTASGGISASYHIFSDSLFILCTDIHYTSRLLYDPATLQAGADLILMMDYFFPAGSSAFILGEADDLKYYYGFNIGLLSLRIENFGVDLLRFSFLWEQNTGTFIMKSNILSVYGSMHIAGARDVW